MSLAKEGGLWRREGGLWQREGRLWQREGRLWQREGGGGGRAGFSREGRRWPYEGVDAKSSHSITRGWVAKLTNKRSLVRWIAHTPVKLDLEVTADSQVWSVSGAACPESDPE
ncbi:hypothetical protein BDR06DRAFT_972091 [Suillus hirtellus]|nr:hypothetical protein BDR06DRAFT_972091 [Suillus hirtellus]